MDNITGNIGGLILLVFLVLRLIAAPAFKRRMSQAREQSRDVTVDPTQMRASEAAAASRAAQTQVDARSPPAGPIQTAKKMKDIDPRGPFL
ncbi:MAG: hypothetical protein H7287_13220 [Thermoleophilia bacterium]|nr:hypothetical protein [Thermoleophilia bacterium]